MALATAADVRRGVTPPGQAPSLLSGTPQRVRRARAARQPRPAGPRPLAASAALLSARFGAGGTGRARHGDGEHCRGLVLLTGRLDGSCPNPPAGWLTTELDSSSNSDSTRLLTSPCNLNNCLSEILLIQSKFFFLNVLEITS